MRSQCRISLALLFVGAAIFASPIATAWADDAWRVGKSSGDVWVVSANAQPVSLTALTELKPGDAVRSGNSGRALLVRGDETILLSPNSAITIPTAPRDGMTTTIIEQVGTILLNVEKQNVQHFEVVTPYLAAVVKGTQFRVSVGNKGAEVSVTRGQVQVSDFKSGQYALVLPGQTANVQPKLTSVLALTGPGSAGQVHQGAPGSTDVKPIFVPKGGLSVPGNLRETQATKAPENHAGLSDNSADHTAKLDHNVGGTGTRISAPLGEVNVNSQKVTKGLARDVKSSSSTNNDHSCQPQLSQEASARWPQDRSFICGRRQGDRGRCGDRRQHHQSGKESRLIGDRRGHRRLRHGAPPGQVGMRRGARFLFGRPMPIGELEEKYNLGSLAQSGRAA